MTTPSELIAGAETVTIRGSMIAKTSPKRICQLPDVWNTEHWHLVSLEAIEDLVAGTSKKSYLLSWMFKRSAQTRQKKMNRTKKIQVFRTGLKCF